METVVIYPYNDSYLPVLDNSSIIINYKVNTIVVPTGWTEEKIYKYKKIYNIDVTCDFEKSIKESDILWLIDDDAAKTNNATLLKNVSYAIFLGKKVLFTRYQDVLLNKIIANYFGPEALYNLNKLELKTVCPDLFMQLFDIDTPILLITGATISCDKYKLSLGLYKEITSKGYKISAISARRDSEVLGLHSMPDFMWECEKKVDAKIIDFNHFVRQIELQETPDLIIIEVPGGSIPYNNKIHNDFGEFTFLISNAVQSDYVIFSSLVGMYDLNYYKKIEKIMREKYNLNINCHYISEKIYDNLVESMVDLEGKFLRADSVLINNLIKKQVSVDVDVYYGEEFEAIAANIVEQLTE